MQEINISKGYKVIVDDDTYKWLSAYKWNAQESSNMVYAIRTHYHLDTKSTIRMHRLILDCPKGSRIIHINGNGLDNRKQNLRLQKYRSN